MCIRGSELRFLLISLSIPCLRNDDTSVIRFRVTIIIGSKPNRPSISSIISVSQFRNNHRISRHSSFSRILSKILRDEIRIKRLLH